MSSESDTNEKLVTYPSVVERYFKKRYKTDVRKKKGEDQCILMHSNRICISTLAPTHPIIAEKKKIKRVDYQVDKNTDRSQNKVTGKSKKGAQWLTELAALCHVTCEDGSSYTLCSCVKGSLVEVNENLIQNPQLLSEKPDSEGYIAMILTRLYDYDKEMNKLLSPEDYAGRLEKRRLQELSKLADSVNKFPPEGSTNNPAAEKHVTEVASSSDDKMDTSEQVPASLENNSSGALDT